MATIKETSLINTIKVWLFPSIITIISYMLYNDITEIKSDVKKLLTQSASDHTEILNLKDNISLINNKVFAETPYSNKHNLPVYPMTIKTPIALLHDDKIYFSKR